MKLILRVVGGGAEQRFELARDRATIGRRAESDVQLPDYSVSRLHAVVRREASGWMIQDQGSTNGIQVNNQVVERSTVRPGDRLTVGAFELLVEADPEVPAVKIEEAAETKDLNEGAPELARATIVRSLDAFTAAFGIHGEGLSRASPAPSAKRRALDAGYESEVFAILTRLGRLLIEATTVDSVLDGLLSVVFDALPVDRGFVLVRDDVSGELCCEVMRSGDTVTVRPGVVPVSHTMLETVARERVTLLTGDALADDRLSSNESVHIHQIRAAICAPLWSDERIIGVMQVDSPRDTDAFTADDVDLLTALANYGAVAIERLRNADRASFERHMRERFERYHSPSVIDAVLAEADENAAAPRRLQPAEVSVLFADVVDFTRFSERASPAEVAEAMEGFFEQAVEAIFDAGGTLDKFIGDCVMAFFGAPMQQVDHACRAVRAALTIQDAASRWSAERSARGQPSFKVRIGVNSGPVVVGDLGSRRRVDYTVLGNAVNVAARLESAVAEPGQIVIGEATRAALDDSFECEPLGLIRLRGLIAPVEAFRVMGSARS